MKVPQLPDGMRKMPVGHPLRCCESALSSGGKCIFNCHNELPRHIAQQKIRNRVSRGMSHAASNGSFVYRDSIGEKFRLKALIGPDVATSLREKESSYSARSYS
jgi:hypothetical protein